MPRYRIEFYGRLIGAEGMSDQCTVDVTASAPGAAELQLYDTHERAGGFIRITKLPQTPDQGAT